MDFVMFLCVHECVLCLIVHTCTPLGMCVRVPAYVCLQVHVFLWKVPASLCSTQCPYSRSLCHLDPSMMLSGKTLSSAHSLNLLALSISPGHLGNKLC